MTSSRQQFEARYPIPRGVQWNPESSRYALVEISNPRNTDSTIARYEAYVHSWSVWKASREDVVVTLPEIKDQDWACGSSECEAMRHGITLSKHAINSAGIKTVQRMRDVNLPERTCQGCGAKGWTANCNECIPY